MIDEALEYLVDKHPRFAEQPTGLARVEGQRAVAQAAMGRGAGRWQQPAGPLG